MLFKRFATAVLLSALFICVSCEKEHFDVQTKIPVQCIYEPIITEMTSSSVIALPSGTNMVIKVINSKEELEEYLPREILDAHPLYEDIDFDNSSFVSLTTRQFYKPYNIQYEIVKNSETDFTLTQIIYHTGELYPQGYFIMSNFVIDKINADSKIKYWQASFGK